jgi:hypothetical protein
MTVAIGTQPCTGVLVTDNVTLGVLECSAPPGPGIGTVQLAVSVQGSGSGTYRFLYAPPHVARVMESPGDAESTFNIQVRGPGLASGLRAPASARVVCLRDLTTNCRMCPPSDWRSGCVGLFVVVVPQVIGSNLGLKSALTSPDPVVYLGALHRDSTRGLVVVVVVVQDGRGCMCCVGGGRCCRVLRCGSFC